MYIQILTLNEGWNLISFCIDFDISKLTNDNRIKQIKNYSESYVLGWGSNNTLKTIVPQSGYWVLSSDQFNLEISGNIYDNNIEIDIFPGWNLIGYPFKDPCLLSTIPNKEHILQIKDLRNSYITNRESHNTITDFKGGKGYLLKAKEEFKLTFEAKRFLVDEDLFPLS